MAILGTIIANPKKTLSINYPIAVVKESAKLVHNYYKDVDITRVDIDDTLNIYKFHINEILSQGTLMVLTFKKITTNATDLEIELQREVGSYDTNLEVSLSNSQINNFLAGLSRVLQLSEEDKKALKAGNLQIDEDELASSVVVSNRHILRVVIIVFIVLSLVTYFIVR
jgi:hypothetical protein